MRAVLIENFTTYNGEIELDSKKTHHFLNVLRLKDGESILLLDGLGHSALAMMHIKSKKSATIIFDSYETSQISDSHIDIAIGKLKKDAMDLSLKMITELGCRNIFILNSKYSQNYSINHERVQKILTSSLEQSNAKFLPGFKELSFEKLKLSEYDKVITFSLCDNKSKESLQLTQKSKVLIIIGPEGGLSEDEEVGLNKLKNSRMIKLDTPILRAPTALACAVGYVKGNLEALNQI